jgi:hypothetical protein
MNGHNDAALAVARAAAKCGVADGGNETAVITGTGNDYVSQFVALGALGAWTRTPSR